MIRNLKIYFFAVAGLLVVGVHARVFDIYAEEEPHQEGKFAVEIEEAILTDLRKAPFEQEKIQPPIGKSSRIRKELRPAAVFGDNGLEQEDPPALRNLDDESVAALAKNMSCGFCEARLMWGDTGVIQSPNFPRPYGSNMDCLWLLRTADEDARIELVCDTIELESCGAQNGFSPSWKDYLIISPLWNFRKSYVYCGYATTLTEIKHTSNCDQMAITFRSNNNDKNYKGFKCTYKVV